MKARMRGPVIGPFHGHPPGAYGVSVHKGDVVDIKDDAELLYLVKSGLVELTLHGPLGTGSDRDEIDRLTEKVRRDYRASHQMTRTLVYDGVAYIHPGPD